MEENIVVAIPDKNKMTCDIFCPFEIDPTLLAPIFKSLQHKVCEMPIDESDKLTAQKK